MLLRKSKNSIKIVSTHVVSQILKYYIHLRLINVKGYSRTGNLLGLCSSQALVKVRSRFRRKMDLVVLSQYSSLKDLKCKLLKAGCLSFYKCRTFIRQEGFIFKKLTLCALFSLKCIHVVTLFTSKIYSFCRRFSEFGKTKAIRALDL